MDPYFSLLNLSFVENYHISIFTTFEKQSIINWLSNSINRNRSAAKISKVMSSNTNTNANENTALHLFVAHSNKQSRNCEDVDVELVNGKMNMQIKQAM